MDLILLNQVITRYYNELYRYASKIASSMGLQNEKQDILHQIFLEILTKNATEGITLKTEGDNEVKTIKHYLRKAIKIGIISSKSRWQRNKASEQKHLDHNISLDQLDIPDSNVSTAPLQGQIWEIFERLELSEHKRLIFCSYYLEGKALKNCHDKYTVATKSKICHSIILKIRDELLRRNEI